MTGGQRGGSDMYCNGMLPVVIMVMHGEVGKLQRMDGARMSGELTRGSGQCVRTVR